MDSALVTDAAELYRRAQATGREVITTLAAALDAHWGCAGSDSAGATWAASYDPAAFDAVAAGTDLVNAYGKMHDLLAFTALNHANTEKANKNPPEPPDGPPPRLATGTSPTFKGAFGGDTDEPFGWGFGQQLATRPHVAERRPRQAARPRRRVACRRDRTSQRSRRDRIGIPSPRGHRFG
jgi:hypothetical protein